MPDNFLVTAERMHDSSKLLHDANHYHNACYTAGYVAECYLKILVRLVSGNPRQYGHDVVRLFNDIDNQINTASTATHLRNYLIDMRINCPNIYNWNPNKRYEDNGNWDNNTMSNSFQQEQEICFAKIISMYIDGLIP
jgi:HEPN domain-containing protein